ncbi:MAG: ABC transporter ATP-binding protein [Nitrospirae bacterium]|nr:MAG: ABC transporter ATP-binding protein [Nitrospirota bacterium]
MAFIKLDSASKIYETAQALRGVDLEVEQGQWLNIVGPSGSGKSTLLNVIGGLDSLSSGNVVIDGAEITGLSEDAMAVFRRERIGFVFQQAHLIPYLNAVENVMLSQYFHSMSDEDEAIEALKRVGLGHRLTHRPSQLSGGEQQRVCIARALINSPKLLLADEPTGNLDRENTRIILELLKKLHQEEHFTIILVTHDPFVSQWGQRIITMEDGKIKCDEFICYL